MFRAYAECILSVNRSPSERAGDSGGGRDEARGRCCMIGVRPRTGYRLAGGVVPGAERRWCVPGRTAPSAGLEPAPPAPEAGALSAELRGPMGIATGASTGNIAPLRTVVGVLRRRAWAIAPSAWPRHPRRTMPARPVIAAAVSRALSTMGIEVDPASVHLERPARRENGDWSTNTALVNAKTLGRPTAPDRRRISRASASRSHGPPRVGGGGRSGIRELPSVAGMAARHLE